MCGTSAYAALAAGECALVATDTVFGLAALPGSAGYGRIFELKQRPHGQALPWLVSGEAMLDEFAEPGHGADLARKLARALWPGALTLVVEASAAARTLGGIADDGTVALRCPQDDACRSLIARLGLPLACTSANLHGQPATSERAQLAVQLQGVPGYDGLPDSCPGGRASTIADCTGGMPRILRQGPVSEEQIARAAL